MNLIRIWIQKLQLSKQTKLCIESDNIIYAGELKKKGRIAYTKRWFVILKSGFLKYSHFNKFRSVNLNECNIEKLKNSNDIIIVKKSSTNETFNLRCQSSDKQSLVYNHLVTAQNFAMETKMNQVSNEPTFYPFVLKVSSNETYHFCCHNQNQLQCCKKTILSIINNISNTLVENKNKVFESETKENKMNGFDLENNHKIEFKNWLCNIVKKEQYLGLFENSDCNDVRIIEDLDDESLEELGINKLHHKLFIKHINRFKSSINMFNKWLNTNNLIKYNIFLNSIGVITLDSFISLLNALKNNPKILINQINYHKGIPFNVLKKIYNLLNIETDYLI